VRTRWIVAAVIALVAIGGAVVAFRLHRPKPAAVVAAPVARQPAEAIFTGRVEPRTVVNATAPIAGVVDALFLDVNQEVYKDQLLGRIRNPEMDASVEQSQADVEKAQERVTQLTADQLAAKVEVSRAEADRSRARAEVERFQKIYERQQGLWQAGATARLTFEKAEKDFKDAQKEAERLDQGAKDAQARVEKIAAEIDAANRAVAEKNPAVAKAKAALNDGEIHSTVDGIVVSRHGQVGDMVEKGAMLFDIATDLEKLQVAVPASPEMRAGQAATVQVAELGAEEIPGVIREIRANQAIIEFNAPSAITKLDLTAQVKIKF
jgi:multidrug resistance efflux pump